MANTEVKKGMANIFWGIVGQIITVAVGLLVPRFVLSHYGSQMNGFLNSITQIFSYMALLEVGVGGATLQALYKPVALKDKKEINRILSATHMFYTKTGYMYSVVLIVVGCIYPIFVDTDIKSYEMALCIIFTGISSCLAFFVHSKFRLLLRADGKNYVSTNITTVTYVLSGTTKIILILLGMNIIYVQLGYGIVSCFTALYLYIYQKKKYSWVSYKEQPNLEAISQRKSVMVQQVGGLIFSSTDVFMLTLVSRDLKIVSVYTIYNLVMTMVKDVIKKIMEGFSFKLGQLYQTNREAYLRLHHMFENFNLIIIFTCITVLYYCTLPFVKLYTKGVYDIEYVNYIVLILFIIIQILDLIRFSPMQTITYAGHFKNTEKRCILEAVINLVCSFVLGIKFGIYGILIGTIIALLYRSNDMVLYAYKYLLEQNPLRTYKRWMVCIGGFIGCIAFLDYKMFMVDTYIQIILVALVIGLGSLIGYTMLLFIVDYRTMFGLVKNVKDLAR